MAWRIDGQVIRGEIDNRMRGRVKGRIWFVGRDEPVELKLEGNCWRDLAGRRLEFTNPEPKPGDLDKFAQLQEGSVGDITASRKVKVLEFPLDQLHLYYKTGREMPWHWGNSLYLEWFSVRNGRVMIESSSFELRIDGDAAWEMTEEEEIEQRKANGSAMTGFMGRLVDAASAQAQAEQADEDSGEGDPEDDEWKPQTEAEADAMQARSDLLADRINARMEREGDEADFEKIMDEEIERMRRERGEPEPTEEDLARRDERINEMNRIAEEALANPDPEIEEMPERRHPLVERTMEFTLRLMRQSEEENWVPEGASNEHPLAELVDGVMCAGPKLGGALDGEEWPPMLDLCAGVIVRLKKARDYLEDSLRAAESCREEKLLPPERLDPIEREIAAIAGEVDGLIAELRAILERGEG